MDIVFAEPARTPPGLIPPPLPDPLPILFDGTFDERMAKLVAQWQKDGRDVGLDGLLLLSYLREHAHLDTQVAADLLQVSPDPARDILERYCMAPYSLIERRGKKTGVTYHLQRAVAADLIGKAARSEEHTSELQSH